MQQLITHLKSRAAVTSLSFNFKRAAGFCCHGEERKKTKQCAHWKHPKASFSERYVDVILGPFDFV